MGDYSLMMMVPNRLAIEGEELAAHRFRGGSLALVSCFDYDSWSAQRARNIWQRFKSWCLSGGEPTPVVCIPPGTRLRIDGLPQILKHRFHLSSWEEAMFIHSLAEDGGRRDAIRFDNSATVPLELLPEGQKMKILRLHRAQAVESDQDRLHLVRGDEAVENTEAGTGRELRHRVDVFHDGVHC